MQARDTKYLSLDDGRKLCLECLDSGIMDTHECQPLYLEIQEFYEGLNMKVEQQVPLLLVERSALNEAMDVEKHVRLCLKPSKRQKNEMASFLSFFLLIPRFSQGHHHLAETRGLCLSEEQTVTTVSKHTYSSRFFWSQPIVFVNVSFILVCLTQMLRFLGGRELAQAIG